MSIFWLGGSERIVPDTEIKKEMFQDRIFLPGIIHGGEDYLIRVYINDVGYEDEPDEFIAEYLTRDLILKAHKEDPSHEQVFNEVLLDEAENFACYNDGSGEFATLVEAWPEAIEMSNSDLVDWAEGRFIAKKSVIAEENVREVLEEKINDIYAYFQKANGIMSGDISPFEALAQDKLTEKLSSLITSVLKQQMPAMEPDEPDNVVWIYHEYQDELAYGEQYMKGFQNKEEGEAFLRQRVEEEYGCPWEEIPEEITEYPHWVSFQYGDGYAFFCLEAVKIN